MADIHEFSSAWASRPSDERFPYLAGTDPTTSVQAAAHLYRQLSVEGPAPVADLGRAVRATGGMAMAGEGSVFLEGTGGLPVALTHNAFGTLAGLAGQPAGALRELPAQLAASVLAWGLEHNGGRAYSGSGDAKLLVRQHRPGSKQSALQALTSVGYGRVWNADVVDALIDVLNSSASGGNWGVPSRPAAAGLTNQIAGFVSDHDMHILQVDESRDIDAPTRGNWDRGGRLQRGIIIGNSETGGRSLWVRMFSMVTVCCNYIIWDAEIAGEIRIRHTSGAPRRFLTEVLPAIRAFVEGSDRPMVERIGKAQETKVGDGKPETMAAWLAARGLSQTVARAAVGLAQIEDGGAETVWQAVQGVTAYARGLDYTDQRVELETIAGQLLGNRSLVDAASFSRSTRAQRSGGVLAA